jgi:hypothetical protein
MEQLVGTFLETSEERPRGLTERVVESKPEVVGLAHSSEEVGESRWSEGAGQLKC